HRAWHFSAPDAARLHRGGKAGRLFGGHDFPARAHALRAKGGPAGVAATHTHAHGATVHAVRRSATASGGDSRRGGKRAITSNANGGRVRRDSPVVADRRAA